MAGAVTVTVSYKQQAKVPLVIVKGDGLSLSEVTGLNSYTSIGRKFISFEHTLWSHCWNAIKLFQEGLGTLWGHKVMVVIDSNATPRFCKA